jgi:uncharacterized protein
MGENSFYSWDDAKREANLAKHDYDFAEFDNIFDGRAFVIAEDMREEYGEARFNVLAEIKNRIVSVTFTHRENKIRLISVRAASRKERSIYDDRIRQS